MFEKLREIGVPTTIATTICVVVIVAPLLFKIDERYVKNEDHEKELQKLELKNNQLERELAQLSGFQSAMVTLIQQGRIPQAATPVASAGAPVDEIERPRMLRSAPAPRVAEPVIPEQPIVGSANVPPEPVASAPVIPLETPRNWMGIKDGLERQQQRLIK